MNPRRRAFVAPIVGVVLFLGAWELFVQARPPQAVRAAQPVEDGVLHRRQPGLLLAQLGRDGPGGARRAAAGAGGRRADRLSAEHQPLRRGGDEPGAHPDPGHPVRGLHRLGADLARLDNRRPALFIATLVCVPAFTFATVAGLRSADRSALEVMRSVDASRREILWRLRLPSALPSLFTAARSQRRPGADRRVPQRGRPGEDWARHRRQAGAPNQNDGDLVWATVFCMAALGTIGLIAISLLERVVLRWHASQRDESKPTRRPPSPATPTRVPSN